MNTISSILVPVDFSDPSKKALGYALRVAREFGASVTLLHVLTRPLPSRYAGLIPAEDDVERRAEAERDLKQLVPSPYRGTVEHGIRTVWGEVEEEILAAIGKAGADLVVMGSHGRRRFKRWFLGSTTERVLRRIPVPVMTVSHAEEAPPDPGAPLDLKRILYPTDFSDANEVALPIAIAFASRFKAELDVVHVLDPLRRSPTSPPYTDEELEQERRERLGRTEAALDAAIARAGSPDLDFRKTVLEGRAADRILSHAASSGAGLIAMTLHGMGYLERALLGATAERVVRGASIPVLSVPFEKTSPAAETP